MPTRSISIDDMLEDMWLKEREDKVGWQNENDGGIGEGFVQNLSNLLGVSWARFWLYSGNEGIIKSESCLMMAIAEWGVERTNQDQWNHLFLVISRVKFEVAQELDRVAKDYIGGLLGLCRNVWEVDSLCIRWNLDGIDLI